MPHIYQVKDEGVPPWLTSSLSPMVSVEATVSIGCSHWIERVEVGALSALTVQHSWVRGKAAVRPWTFWLSGLGSVTRVSQGPALHLFSATFILEAGPGKEGGGYCYLPPRTVMAYWMVAMVTRDWAFWVECTFWLPVSFLWSLKEG